MSYFVRNPQAVDTLEGVAQWRLLEERVHRNVEQTNAALEWLVSQGFLLELSSASSRHVFCLNPERHVEAEHFLGRVRGRRSNRAKGEG